VLRELAKESGETAHVAVLAGDKALLVEVCDSHNSLRVASRSGAMVDLYCSSTGKVLLAACEESYREELIKAIKPVRRTSNTIATQQELREELVRTTARGYGLDDEEYMEGVRCLAAPVRGVDGRVVAAIGITGATLRFTRGEIPRIAKLVKAAADELSLRLGYAS
jgi:DNA-binding IclR family transcriptional regulator